MDTQKRCTLKAILKPAGRVIAVFLITAVLIIPKASAQVVYPTPEPNKPVLVEEMNAMLGFFMITLTSGTVQQQLADLLTKKTATVNLLSSVCPTPAGTCTWIQKLVDLLNSVSVAPGCGDGVLRRSPTPALNETCDDGNTMAGDGCGATCQLEAGTTTTCGDNIISGNEICDFPIIKTCTTENNTPGLLSVPCISNCTAFGTAGQCVPISNITNSSAECGNGSLKRPTETCDDGNILPGDGCGATCQLEGGTITTCGDHIISGNEYCDFPIVETCTTENGTPGLRSIPCINSCSVFGSAGSCVPISNVSVSGTECGNGSLKRPTETCDDGNTAAGDGCGATCQLEAGTTTTCGDGIISGNEYCDFPVVETCTAGANNDIPGIKVIPCINSCGEFGTASQCMPIGNISGSGIECGNGVLRHSNNPALNETCDDGNTAAGDGCGATCQLEAGTTTTCGDGIISGDEYCDFPVTETCTTDANTPGIHIIPCINNCKEFGPAGICTDLEAFAIWQKNGNDIYYNKGNVGIGTATPSNKLDVAGSVKATSYKFGLGAGWMAGGATDDLQMIAPGGVKLNNSDLYFTKTNHSHTGFGNTNGYAAIENAEDFGALMILGRAGTAKGRYVKLWDYLSVVGSMDVVGDVGIGTATPSAKLDVSGSAKVSGFTNSAGYTFKNGGARIDGGDDLILNGLGGNVGIGKSPTEKLDVDGQIRIRGGNPGLNKVLTSSADGTASWELTQGDNLGNHTATQALSMGGFDITNASRVGIGVAPTTALDVNGQVKIRGGSPGIGKLLVSDANGLASWQSPGAISKVSIAGQTAALDGSQGGYTGANAKCNAVSAGSHVCTTEEVFSNINNAGILPASGDFWVTAGSSFHGNGLIKAGNDCNGWKANTIDYLGTYWDFDEANGGASYFQNCDSSNALPFLCCK